MNLEHARVDESFCITPINEVEWKVMFRNMEFRLYDAGDYYEIEKIPVTEDELVYINFGYSFELLLDEVKRFFN
jgi:hypothetical protein